MYLHGSYFSVTFLPLSCYFLVTFCYNYTTFPLLFAIFFATFLLLYRYRWSQSLEGLLSMTYPIQFNNNTVCWIEPATTISKVYSRGPGCAKPFCTILWLIFDHIGSYLTNLDQLGPNCLFGPVYLDPSIWTHVFGPIYLVPHIWTCLFGPCLFGPIYL